MRCRLVDDVGYGVQEWSMWEHMHIRVTILCPGLRFHCRNKDRLSPLHECAELRLLSQARSVDFDPITVLRAVTAHHQHRHLHSQGKDKAGQGQDAIAGSLNE